MLLKYKSRLGIVYQGSYHRLPLLYRCNTFEGEGNPLTKEACPHGRIGAIQNIFQTTSLLIHRGEKLQTTCGKAIDTHILLLINAMQRGDMPQFVMLCKV